MKIVNEKGKLFGIINIVDLVIIVCLALGIFAAVYKFAAPTASDIVAPKSDMYVMMRIRGAMDYLDTEVKKLEPGARLVAGSSYVADTEVVGVGSIPYRVAATSDEAKIITAEDAQKKDLIVVIKAKQDKNDAIYKIGNQEVRVGRGFIFKTQTVEVNAIIEQIAFDAPNFDGAHLAELNMPGVNFGEING